MKLYYGEIIFKLLPKTNKKMALFGLSVLIPVPSLLKDIRQGAK